jgi:hypothetical protein
MDGARRAPQLLGVVLAIASFAPRDAFRHVANPLDVPARVTLTIAAPPARAPPAGDLRGTRG